MKNSNDDFKTWYLENGDLFERLYNKDSVLFHHIKDIIDCLAYISDKIEYEKVDDELLDIFETGYSYLYSYISTLKVYLNNYFDDDLDALIKYDMYLRYSIYLNDIKDMLIEENIYNDKVKEEFEYVLNDIEKVLKEKHELKEDKTLEYDEIITSVIPKDKYYQTIPEVFSEVKDALEI